MQGRKYSKEGKKAVSEGLRKRYLKPDERRKTSEATKKLWKDPLFVMKMMEAHDFKPNKPEQYLMDVLELYYPGEWKYTGDFSFWVNGKNPDFVHRNGKNLIIELFGDYWHRDQNPKDRADIFAAFGYKTLVVWERELKEFDSLVVKISSFINENDVTY